MTQSCTSYLMQSCEISIFFFFSADGSSGFKAEKGRYHLYVALACPFAHRAIIGRAVKGLEDVISMDVVHPVMDKEMGWKFDEKVNWIKYFNFNFCK